MKRHARVHCDGRPSVRGSSRVKIPSIHARSDEHRAELKAYLGPEVVQLGVGEEAGVAVVPVDAIDNDRGVGRHLYTRKSERGVCVCVTTQMRERGRGERVCVQARGGDGVRTTRRGRALQKGLIHPCPLALPTINQAKQYCKAAGVAAPLLTIESAMQSSGEGGGTRTVS